MEQRNLNEKNTNCQLEETGKGFAKMFFRTCLLIILKCYSPELAWRSAVIHHLSNKQSVSVLVSVVFSFDGYGRAVLDWVSSTFSGPDVLMTRFDGRP